MSKVLLKLKYRFCFKNSSFCIVYIKQNFSLTDLKLFLNHISIGKEVNTFAGPKNISITLISYIAILFYNQFYSKISFQFYYTLWN